MAKTLGAVKGDASIENGMVIIRFDRSVLVDLIAKAALQAFDIMDVDAPTAALRSTVTSNGSRKRKPKKVAAVKRRRRTVAAAVVTPVARKQRRKRDEAAITQKRMATMARNRAAKAGGQAPAGGWPGAEAAAAR